MSAYIVPDFHINALVTWAVANKAPAFPKGITPRALGELLHEANCASVDYRYQEHNPRTYRCEQVGGYLSPVQVIKACDCLDYQSCERPDWIGSQAQFLLSRIREHAISRLPGYAQAAWCLDNEEALA